MKLIYTFEKIPIDDNIVAVPIGNDELKCVINLNSTASVIFDILKDDVTEQKIVELLLEEYNIDKKELSIYVHDFVAGLIAEGLVE